MSSIPPLQPQDTQFSLSPLPPTTGINPVQPSDNTTIDPSLLVYDYSGVSGGMNSGATYLGGNNPGGMNSGAIYLGGINPGGRNSGATNPGGINPGGMNSGGINPGVMYSGGMNSGVRNSGGMNSGVMNPGGMNSGGMNSGGLNLAAGTLPAVNSTNTLYKPQGAQESREQYLHRLPLTQGPTEEDGQHLHRIYCTLGQEIRQRIWGEIKNQIKEGHQAGQWAQDLKTNKCGRNDKDTLDSFWQAIVRDMLKSLRRSGFSMGYQIANPNNRAAVLHALDEATMASHSNSGVPVQGNGTGSPMTAVPSQTNQWNQMPQNAVEVQANGAPLALGVQANGAPLALGVQSNGAPPALGVQANGAPPALGVQPNGALPAPGVQPNGAPPAFAQEDGLADFQEDTSWLEDLVNDRVNYNFMGPVANGQGGNDFLEPLANGQGDNGFQELLANGQGENWFSEFLADGQGGNGFPNDQGGNDFQEPEPGN
ncbi:hypothetical protein V8F20_006665 [Naviculisporaceae sp. PSN 640]